MNEGKLVKIKITSVKDVEGVRHVTFNQMVKSTHGFTQAGKQALRILAMFHGRYRSTSGNPTDKVAVRRRPNSKTTAELQKAFDSWINTKLAVVEFEAPIVRASSNGQQLRNKADVSRARRMGQMVEVRFNVRTNLPLILEDQEAIGTALPKNRYIISPAEDNLFRIEVAIFMRDDLAGRDPWKLAKELEPKIKAALR
jgi:hypothetical protein